MLIPTLLSGLALMAVAKGALIRVTNFATAPITDRNVHRRVQGRRICISHDCRNTRQMATVFLVGTSSGAMMGNVLAAIYPDVLAATAVYSGTAAGARLSRPGLPRTHNGPRWFGHITKPTQQWGKIV
ncbi:putative Acetylxylan esterase A [Seiridium cardinale]|uniref:Acetylxylan esterase A n=1 Tax=Seiridium cardinale TaxID=138064 RepID=A0ABR2XXJ6_9PEZI